MAKIKAKPRLRTPVIREIKPGTHAEAMFRLVRQMNGDITKSEFNQRLEAMQSRSYRCLGAFDGAQLVGICGLWHGTRFWCGDYIEIDNFIIDRSQRNRGIGRLLLEWTEKEAKRLNCRMVMADSYTHNTASHRFYYREGYVIKGFCFVKELK